MPTDALPQPRVDLGQEHLRRTYLDALKRPLTGEVTISGAQRASNGEAVVVPAAVKVRITDGVLDVVLPAGEYQLQATLRTVDGIPVQDSETITL